MKTKLEPMPLSKLINIALADLRKVENDERYTINMGRWHIPNESTSKCMVCLAGAVIANTLEAPHDLHVAPSMFEETDRNTSYMLRALDDIRLGLVGVACYFYKDTWPADYSVVEGNHYMPVASYHGNRNQFFEDVEKIATFLASKGL